MITTVWNSAIAAGGILGGLLLERLGAGAFPWAVLPLCIVALIIASGASRHGFVPGPRAIA